MCCPFPLITGVARGGGLRREEHGDRDREVREADRGVHTDNNLLIGKEAPRIPRRQVISQVFPLTLFPAVLFALPDSGSIVRYSRCGTKMLLYVIARRAPFAGIASSLSPTCSLVRETCTPLVPTPHSLTLTSHALFLRLYEQMMTEEMMTTVAKELEAEAEEAKENATGDVEMT